MIKAIILDVDGVLVGSKKGYNWPFPHIDVINALKTLRSQGIFISLCTGKGTFAIKEIVEKAHLNNLHIGDGGAAVIDFIAKKIIEKHIIQKNIVREVVQILLKNNIYVELYTVDGYYIQKNHIPNIREKHSAILYRTPMIVNSLLDEIDKLEIIKIMPIGKNEKEKLHIAKLFQKYSDKLSLQWGIHPTANPLQFGIITTQNISKKQAAITISKKINVPFEHILGVGDGMTDWNFIQLCRYAGIMGNASDKLKKIVCSKKKENYYIGPSVNKNGVLSIFKHFGLKI